MIILTNPHNPSGVTAPRESLEAVVRLAESVGGRVLVADHVLHPVPQGRLVPTVDADELLKRTGRNPGVQSDRGSGLPLLRLGRFFEMLMLLDVRENTGLFTELVETAQRFLK